MPSHRALIGLRQEGHPVAAQPRSRWADPLRGLPRPPPSSSRPSLPASPRAARGACAHGSASPSWSFSCCRPCVSNRRACPIVVDLCRAAPPTGEIDGDPARASIAVAAPLLEGGDVRCRRALRPLLGVVADLCALGQRLEAATLD